MENNSAGAERGETGRGYLHTITSIRRQVLQLLRLLRDIFQHFPAATARILVAAASSLGCQVLALVGLYAYLKALENNGALLGYPARESPQLFAIIATVTLLLLIGFALLEYRANISILNITRLYQRLGTAQAIAASSQLPHWFTAENEPHISTRHLRQILSVDVHHRSRIARLLLLSIIPAARLVLCGVALLYLNLQFSVLILFAVGLPVVGLYSVGRKVADTVTVRESGSPPVFLRQREMLENSWQQGTQLSAGGIDWDTSMGQPDSRYRQYFRRLRTKAYGTFLINIANTVGIMVLVLALGFWMLMEREGNWSLWLTYLVVLRYFLSSLRSTAQSVVTSTRYLRQSQRFTAFLAAATSAVNSTDPRTVSCPDHIAQAFKGDGGVPDSDDEIDDE